MEVQVYHNLGKHIIRFGGQSSWSNVTQAQDVEVEIIVDYVGRFENLEEDFNVIRDKLKITTRLPKKNVSIRGDYRSAYDNEMIEFVYKHCEKDIKEFGYEF